MIDLKNVSFSYDQRCTLSNLTLHMEKGEFAAVIGSNGAGKSTLCRLLNGLLKPASGIVSVNGMNTKTTRSSVLARHVGFLFQNPDRQICRNTISDEIRFGLELLFQDMNIVQERLQKTLALFGFDGSANPFHLSRGERQQVALASIIAPEPGILILDEPTTGLDYRECMRMMEIIRGLNQTGVTVIMICHDMEVVLDFAKRVIVLSEGRIIADGKTREIFRREDVLERASLLPPQITGLALRLGESFDNVYTIDEMTDVIAAKFNRRGAASA